MESEANRLESFNDWNYSCVDKNILAAMGCFRVNVRNDLVRCFFFNIDIGFWEEGDNPVEDHHRYSPGCPLLNRRETNNIPIDASRLSEILSPAGSSDVRPDVTESEGVISIPDRGITFIELEPIDNADRHDIEYIVRILSSIGYGDCQRPSLRIA